MIILLQNKDISLDAEDRLYYVIIFINLDRLYPHPNNGSSHIIEY